MKFELTLPLAAVRGGGGRPGPNLEVIREKLNSFTMTLSEDVQEEARSLEMSWSVSALLEHKCRLFYFVLCICLHCYVFFRFLTSSSSTSTASTCSTVLCLKEGVASAPTSLE